MNDDNLESKALCKVQKFHECSFCSNRRHAAGKLLVNSYTNKDTCYIYTYVKRADKQVDTTCKQAFKQVGKQVGKQAGKQAGM